MLEIKDAEKLCKRDGMIAVIIIEFEAEKTTAVSYGRNKRYCKEYGEKLEQIMIALENGDFDL